MTAPVRTPFTRSGRRAGAVPGYPRPLYSAQAGIAASELGFYDFTGRTAQRHRTKLRKLTGWHECSKTDTLKRVSHLVDAIWHALGVAAAHHEAGAVAVR
ncbi:hypothetical protein [Streptomyces sp. NPDC056304]|uniref:hypothetical protein n=1 Tax=Streptomyces sp. NPDC056304 TaxID=3345778 RepID=UPI0035D8E700